VEFDLPTCRTCRVFVIGDTAADLEPTLKTLETAGYESVALVDDFEHLAPRFRLWRPDLMVLDLSVPDEGSMPDKGETGRLARVHAVIPEEDFVPVLALVADSSPALRASVLRHGANDVLIKPFSTEELLTRVDCLLSVQLLHRHNRRPASFPDQAQSPHPSEADAQFLRAMLNSMQEGVLACDADGWLTFANPAAAEYGLNQPGSKHGPQPTSGPLQSVRGTPLPVDDDPLGRAWNGQQVHGQKILVSHPRHGQRVITANAQQILVDPGTRLGAMVVLHDVTETHRVTESLRCQVLHDEVTGLPNRVLFLDRLEHAIAKAQRDHRPIAVMMLVVRHPQATDDEPDGAGTETILAALAQRLQLTLRSDDTSARLDDGFVVLCAAPVAESNARLIADRLRVALCRPVTVGERLVTPNLHIGIAIARGAELPAEQVLHDAHAAALDAERLGGNRNQLLECLPRQMFLESHDIVADLQHALPGGELSVYYQPMVDLVSGETVGAEALARWNRPGQGPVSPTRFIPVAAHNGLLVQLGHWVLQTACHQLSTWQKTHLLNDRFVISINVSTGELVTPGWIDQVDQIIRNTGIDPRRVLLEVTPSALTAVADAATETLRTLRTRGPGVALAAVDATETALAHLQRVPAEMVKIDRALVSAIVRDDTVTQTARRIIALTREHGKISVAEGIEADVQASALVALGCDLGQGHYFAKPLPAERLTVLLRPKPNIT
jgi:diguanylate cyclase (GGDEF)-like protein